MKKENSRCLITGGCGFVGYQVVDYFLQNTDWDLILIDGLTYAGNLNRITNLKNYDEKRIKFVFHNLRAPLNDYIEKQIGEVDYIFHLAANSSVEDTIKNPVESVYDNVVGTVNMLEFARKQKNLKLMNYFSTDETMGPVEKPGDGFDEDSPHRPSNPYSAGKAGAEDYCHAYFITYKLPVFITRTMNVLGFDQNKEKYIPTVVRCIQNEEELPVYSTQDGTKSGSRYWIFAQDVADALVFLSDKAVPGEKYHIVGEWSDNLELAQSIAKKIGKPLKYKMFDFHSSRPGHDLHYGLKDTKMKDMGWSLKMGLENGLNLVVPKYLEDL